MTEITQPDATAPSWRQNVLVNARIIIPASIVQSALYLALNHFPLTTAHLLPLTAIDRATPFLPWTIWPYALMILTQPIPPLFVSRDVLMRILRAYIPAMLVTFLIFALFPTTYPRPDISPDGIYGQLFSILYSIDTPRCCFPSGHIVGPAIICMVIWIDARNRGLKYRIASHMLLVAFAICSLSILTTKQHYAWDLFGALLLAAIAVFLSEVLGHRK